MSARNMILSDTTFNPIVCHDLGDMPGQTRRGDASTSSLDTALRFNALRTLSGSRPSLTGI